MAKEFSLEEALGQGKKKPTEFSLDEALGAPAAPAEDAEDRTVGESVKDVGAGLVSGLGSLVQLPGQLYGLATGDFSDSGLLGVGKDITEYGQEMKSEGLKAREAARAKAVEEASKEGQFAAFTTALGDTITDPALLTNFLAEQAPQIIPMILAGGGAGLVASRTAMSAATAKGAALEAAKAIAAKKAAQVGTATALQTGAVMQGADIGAGSYDEIVAELIAKGVSEEDAAAEAINKARAAGVTGYALSVLANRYLPGGKALEEILAGKRLTGSRLGSAAVTGLKEIPSENIEEVGGRVAQNVAARAAGLDRDIMEGAGETAALATLGAAGIGGGAGALSRRQDAAAPAETPEALSEFERDREEFARQYGPAEAVQPGAEDVDQAVEAAEPVVEPPLELPGGFTVTRRELSRQDVPEAFGIFPEGGGKPLATVATEEDAQKKLESLTQIRQEEEKRLSEEADKITNGLLAEERKIEVMEATGQAGTDQYVQAIALLEQKKLEGDEKLVNIRDQIASYSTPLTFAPTGTRTEVQNEFIVNRGEEQIGVFPSFEAVESTVRDLEPEAFKQAEVEFQTKKIEDVLKPAFAKFNLGDVGLNIVEAIKTDTGGLADGAYARNLIRIAVDADKPLQTMRHETVHALKELGFFTPQQWKALTERAEKQWINEYLGNERADVNGVEMSRLDAYKEIAKERKLTPEQLREEIVEEAIADAFGAYSRGATPPPGLIAALYKKLKNFFLNFGQALRGAGFESADDIFQRIERGELKPRKPAKKDAVKAERKEETQETAEKLSLKTIDDVINDGVDRLVKTARKGQINQDQDRFMVGKARADSSLTKVQDGIEKRLIELGVSTKRDERGNVELETIIQDKVLPAYRAKLKKFEDVRFGEEKYEPPVKASITAVKQADKYEEENGIRPYVPEGKSGFPVQPPKYSIQKYNPDKHLKFDPTLGVPINKDGTVTVYYHTTKQKSLQIGQSKVIPSDGRNRVYLSNESGGDAILRNKGNFDQEFDGSTVLVYVTPDMLQLDAEYENGRRDFFIPLQEGDFFNKKMKMQSIQKGREDAITDEFSYADHEEKISRAVKAYKDASPAERRKLISQARKTLKKEHNVGSLLSENGKLEKTRIGEYGLDYEGNSVASQGLGLAAAQKITEKVSTCPRSAICEGLCLGETSGGNFMFGGTASEDVADIKKSAFRAGPRMMQYLKTEAMIINPEAFATLLQAEIDSLKKWSAAPTQIKIDPETKKRLNVEKEIYQPAVRLNVTSDFKPEMFRGIIEGNPDVRFYDYTKLGGESLAENHHLTYSSTGFGQIIDGKKVFFKTKAGQYDHNWATMRKRLNNGQNVAMAFSSKSALPKTLLDEETQTEYRIWDGDDYDARFLDPKQPDGKGMIIGLRNKAGNLSEKNATEKTDGFFVKYDPKKDGDTVVVPDQLQFKEPARKTIPLKQEKFSLRAPTTPEFKRWFGDSKIVDADGKPLLMYHGTSKDVEDFTRKEKRGTPIFLTSDPRFADRFAMDSVDVATARVEQVLTKEQIAEGRKIAIAAIRKDYRSLPEGKVMIDSIKTEDYSKATPEAKEYLRNAYKDMMPSGPNVLPVYVSAQNPFDYENPSHIQMVVDELNKKTDEYGRKIGDLDKGHLATGNWELIETKGVQDAILKSGFDSFYVKEDGRKNIAVYESAQVKSALSNVGTYDRNDPRLRYSLKNVAFPSVKAVKEAVSKTSVPETQEFKRFIAGNQWIDEDGKAAVFYHGTANEFFEFTPAGNARAIFLSRTPEEAEFFGRIAEDRRRQEIYKILNKDEKLNLFQDVLDEQVKKGSITEKQASDFMRDAKRKVPEYGKFGDFDSAIKAGILDLSPTRMSIMPLYARAETPFDFENKEHVDQVIQWVANNTDYPQDFPDKWLSGLKGRISQGLWRDIESDRVQKAIQRLGFDSFTLRMDRDAPKSYAVRRAEQVKSVTDNSGEFDREAKNISYSLRSFRKEDLPQNARDYTLPENTLLYHGAYKERADRIEEMGSVLLSRPPMRVSGGSPNEGGLIFFGSEETARRYADSEADPMAVESARKAGVERLPGKVFETATDRPYQLINRDYTLNAQEAKVLTEALGLPDYKALGAGNKLSDAVTRAVDYDNSKIDRYEVIQRTGQGKQKISAPWPVIFRALGVDGFYDSFGIALTADNGIKLVGKDGKLEKYSLPAIPQGATDRINETTTVREEKGFARRIVEAISPETRAKFRAMALNRYNQLSQYDKKLAEKMGGAVLLADQSAESAALMSDVAAGVAASAMGFGNRTGGIPVLRNGITTIDSSVKGLIASLEPLAKYGDPKVYQRYQYWAMVKRGVRLNAQGKETGITSADVAFAKMLEQKHPEFVSVQKDLIAFNNGLVKYMVDTGVLSKGRAAEYVKYADYVPFYRQMDGETTVGPNLFQSISGVRPPKKLKGGDAPLADFLETMVRNTTAAIQAGSKNYAGQRAMKVVTQVKAPGMGATRLDRVSTAPNVINILEDGELVSYETADELLLYAVKSLNLSELPFMSVVSKPADWLRNLVTRDPGFMMANLLRDSLSAYVTSGKDMTPVVDTVINFGKALGNMSPTTRALLDAGVISGYDTGNIEESGRNLEQDLARKAGKRRDSMLLRPFKSVWEGLEAGTTASDAATRAVIYDRVLAETGNEAEALYRALEVMNFHRKGGSALVRVLTAAVPFFNARLQGLDLFYRASTGNMNTQDSVAVRNKFWARGMTMMALSGLYWFLVSDDEEYKKQEQETKDNNWLFPGLGFRIPTPFEVGFLFKTVPERIAAFAFGDDTGQDFAEAIQRGMVSTFAFNPMPQTFKPLWEVYTDKSSFTGRSIVGEGLKDVTPKYQVGPSTSKTAIAIGQTLGLSPMKVDHVIKGYTGTMGMYGIDTIDAIINQFSDTPSATKRFEQMPVIKRFALDPEARGNVTQYYQLKDSVDTVVRTMNLLEKTGEYKAYVDYVKENRGTLAFKDYISDTERTMKELRTARTAIRASAMSGDEKRDALLQISKAESQITSQIQRIKTAIASAQ